MRWTSYILASKNIPFALDPSSDGRTLARPSPVRSARTDAPGPAKSMPGGSEYRRAACGISVVFVGPAVAPVAGQGRYHIHADAISAASWTAIHSNLTGGVVAPRWDLAGYASLHLHGHAVRLMKRRGRQGLGGSCDGQNKSNSDQPDHCHLHKILARQGDHAVLASAMTC